MVKYTVISEINLNADSVIEAALKAQKAIVTEFKIINSKTGEESKIDLEDYVFK